MYKGADGRRNETVKIAGEQRERPVLLRILELGCWAALGLVSCVWLPCRSSGLLNLQPLQKVVTIAVFPNARSSYVRATAEKGQESPHLVPVRMRVPVPRHFLCISVLIPWSDKLHSS